MRACVHPSVRPSVCRSICYVLVMFLLFGLLRATYGRVYGLLRCVLTSLHEGVSVRRSDEWSVHRSVTCFLNSQEWTIFLIWGDPNLTLLNVLTAYYAQYSIIDLLLSFLHVSFLLQCRYVPNHSGTSFAYCGVPFLAFLWQSQYARNLFLSTLSVGEDLWNGRLRFKDPLFLYLVATITLCTFFYLG